jgi:hypothetical protein
MSNDLVVVQPAPLAQPGGLGINFGSKLFHLKPATLSINQINTQAEGAIKGKLRVSETGDQFDSMTVTLLETPVEKRQYYAGKKGEMNRNPGNLMCFCSNVVRDSNNNELSGPDAKAKVPGALRCYGCPKSSWERYRQTKDRDDIPPCESFYQALLIDTEYKMPLKFYIRSTGKKPFESGMQNISRKFAMMIAKGFQPNIFDIKFTLSTVAEKKGQTVTYVPVLSNFEIITPEERQSFGEIFQSYVASKNAPPALPVNDANDVIDAEVVEPSGDTPSGEIAI